MNEIFNFHGQEVRTLTIDDEPWFVGKDVADILGYSKARNAIALHVDEEDALKQGIPIQASAIHFQIVPLILLFWNQFDVYLRDKQETQGRMKLKKLSKFD